MRLHRISFKSFRDTLAALAVIALVGVIYVSGRPASPVLTPVRSTRPVPSPPSGLPVVSKVPILFYHHPPADFGHQLNELSRKHYHVIDLDQLYEALAHHAKLPSKPAVITFDDGFKDQLTAFKLLKKYRMKATFFIIVGGPDSRWCIGAGRRYHDPHQPKSGCGDPYLNWKEVKMLDRSGLITIGGHTIDHPDLPLLSPAKLRYEIVEGKKQLEAELGHPVYHFAYPYGDYNSAVIATVKKTGYITAVTTKSGLIQTTAGRFALFRVRDVADLP